MLPILSLLLACTPTEQASPSAPSAPPVAVAPAAVQEPLVGGPFPALLLAQAQFVKDASGKPKPGPALLTIWRKAPDGTWSSTKLEDSESNVFHKAIATPDGIYTVGAEGAFLKRWKRVDGAWKAEALWNPKWGGKFNRVRDLEIGDVDGDGKDDLVMATHDMGVVAVGRWKADGTLDVTEFNQQADTFVHEIELGDVDGDGKNEIYATPSGRNQSSGKSQPGKVVRFTWNATTSAFDSAVVDDLGDSHAKEILCADLDGDKNSELFSVVEAETALENGKPKIVRPVEIRQYTAKKDGTFSHAVVTTLDDLQTRFLVHGDMDGDGAQELVAAAMKSGIWVIKKDAKDWSAENIERNSSGFEHASWPTDLDGDGKLELYVASDEQRELRRYAWNAASKVYEKTVIGPIPPSTITWNVTSGSL